MRGLGASYPGAEDGEEALVDLSLEMAPGEILGVAGESGSGKTTLTRVLARLLRATAGEVELGGLDWLTLRGAALRRERRRVQLVFQDPWSSLDPRQRVGRAIGEAARIHGAAGLDVAAIVERHLGEVGLPAEFGERYPHELSGGERQRVALARALATRPELLIADEPVSALDAPVKLQIVEVLSALRARRGLALLIVTHELALLERIADRVAVLQRGRLVEIGPARDVLRAPAHPYTEALVRSRSEPLRGEPLSGSAPGCLHRSACASAFARCAVERPRLVAVGPGRSAACHAREAIPTRPHGEAEVEPFPPGDVE